MGFMQQVKNIEITALSSTLDNEKMHQHFNRRNKKLYHRLEDYEVKKDKQHELSKLDELGSKAKPSKENLEGNNLVNDEKGKLSGDNRGDHPLKSTKHKNSKIL